MERVMVGKHALLNRRPRWLFTLGLSLVFALMLSGTAWAQLVAVSGTVTSAAGVPLPGVTVRVQGTDTRTVTDASGHYRLSAPADAVLTFAHVGDRPVQTTVSGRTTVDVTMAAVTYLEEVVVTAYTEQRRADITGAVASVDMENAKKQTQASVLKALDARPGRDGSDERLARLAQHRPNPRHQLVPEQRSALRRRRHAGSGFVHQLAEPGGHRVDPGAEGRVGRVDLRIARQQRRHRDRDDQAWPPGPAES